MFTVIVSVWSSAMHELPFHDVTNHVQDRSMDLLHARRHRRWHVDVNGGDAANPAAVASGQCDRLESTSAGQLEGRDHVARFAAGADAERDIARFSQRFDLAREDPVE